MSTNKIRIKLPSAGTLLPMCSIISSQSQHLINVDFGSNFKWGVATAGHQIEGGANEDDPGLSIWDKFAHTSGKIHNCDNDDVTTNFIIITKRILNYFTNLNSWSQNIWGKEIKPVDRYVLTQNISTMGWEAYREGIYGIPKRFSAHKSIRKIIITENVVAYPNTVKIIL